MKKISLPVVVTVMCVMISVVLGLSYLNRENKQDLSSYNQVSDIKKEVGRNDYSNITKKTLDWIDWQRNDEGWYILERGCDFDKKTCDTVLDNEEGNKDGLIATWARFNYYQQNKDSMDLAIVQSDIDKFYEKYPDGVDNALWICKITYDMWKSDLFDEGTKDKLQNICFKSELQQLYLDSDGYQQSKLKLFRSFDVKSNNWDSWLEYATKMRGFDNYFGLVSDLVSQYLWTKDKSKLILAEKYFDSYKKIIESSDRLFGVNNICLAGLSVLDLYEYGGKDEDVLDYAREKYSYLKDIQGDRKTVVCGLFFKRMYQLDSSVAYLNSLSDNELFLTSLLFSKEYFDVAETDGYGFFVTTYGGETKVPYKNVAENGLALEFLRD